MQRVTRPRRGFTSLAAAPDTFAGLDLRPMLQQGQLLVKAADEGLTAAEPCYALAASSLARTGFAHLTSSPHENLQQSLVEKRAIT